MRKLLCLFLAVLSTSAHADWLVGLNSGYHSSTDGNTKFEFSDMINHAFLGASIGSKDLLYIGQNISYQSTQYKTTGTDKISVLELGPRFNYYFNTEKTVLLMLAWNPYAKGTRTTSSGASQDISGWSYLAGLGYEVKMSRGFYLGASIMYHNINITKYELSNVSTEVSESYSSIMPMINLSFRFR